MKLVFYGGGDAKDNKDLDKSLLHLVQKSPKIVFIPSSSYMCDVDFKDFVKQYRKFHIEKFINFPIDLPYTQVLLKEVLSADIIHLSGGNTYYFLAHLRKNKLIEPLRKFVKRGGILTGLSAGAIIMTKDIELAGYPSFDHDINYDGMTNLKSLNLTNFSFFPHYVHSARFRKELSSLSKERKNKVIYASYDGSGIIVHKNELQFIGKVYCYYNGEVFKVR